MTHRTTVAVALLVVVGGMNARGQAQPRPVDRIRAQVIMGPPLAGARLGGGDCPHYWGSSHLDTLPVAGKSTNVPEYNDCQRLIVATANALAYGPVASIFVRYNAHSLFYRPAAANGGSARVLNPDVATPPPPAIIVRTEMVGIIYADGDYAPLGIKKGYDCLTFQWKVSLDATVPIDPSALSAWVTPVGNTPNCSTVQPGANAPAQHALKVSTVMSTNRLYSIPQVSRWDWDTLAKVHYISMICPTGWCEISQPLPAYRPSRVYPAVGWLAAVDQHVTTQKGWYDEQLIADPYGGTSPRLTANKVVGTVFPVGDLEGRTIAAYRGKGWQQAAWVSLSDDSPAYFRKYGFKKNPAPGASASVNAIALCFAQTSNSGECGANKPACAVVDSVHGGRWYAKVTNAGERDRLFCVAYRPSPFAEVQPPGVVRWRWTLKDETIWISCPSGCCEIDSNSIS